MSKIHKLKVWETYIRTRRWAFSDIVSSGPANHLTNLLNSIFPFEGNEFSYYEELPPGYHFLYNNPMNSILGHDGYDNYQAPLDLSTNENLFKRRMWASGHILFKQEKLKIGTQLKCLEKVTKVKQLGSSVFVYIDRDFINSNGDPQLKETRSLIYTDKMFSAKTSQDPQVISTIPKSDANDLCIKLSDDQIKRYSALTYNLHRIHYDPSYCQIYEQLPNVLVQGPFLVTLLLYWIKWSNPEWCIRSFKYKNSVPCFPEETIVLSYVRKDGNIIIAKAYNQARHETYVEGMLRVS